MSSVSADTFLDIGRMNLKAECHLFLVTFLICNALVASIAVWNLGLARGLESSRCMQQSSPFWLA